MGNKRRTEAVDDDFDWYMPNDPGRSSLVVNSEFNRGVLFGTALMAMTALLSSQGYFGQSSSAMAKFDKEARDNFARGSALREQGKHLQASEIFKESLDANTR